MKDNGCEHNGKGEDTVEESAQIQETPEEIKGRLRAEIDAKAKEAEGNYGRFLRAVADLENYKKRADKEKADAISYANEDLISEILPVVDNFERALSHASEGDNIDSLSQGVKHTIDQMYATLKKFGLQDIKALGEKFDPSLHHAICEEEGGEPGTVVKEFQKGYFLKGRLLRPSMVAVSKATEGSGLH